MAIHEAFRAAQKPGPDYAERVVEDVRQKIAAEPQVLRATRERRDDVLAAANSFAGAAGVFPSGSLAHGTVNNPVSDGDGGVVLDRRTWLDLGPDGNDIGPELVMRQMGTFVLSILRLKYPRVTCRLIKRALVFEFHQPLDDEDPSVDLVICLTRRDRPGYWIPNRDKGSWDASHPEKHTQLMTADPKDVRVFRARVIRLVKAAIKNDEKPVVCPWNISALALKHLTAITAVPEAVAFLLHRMAFDLAQGDTPDPAKVSAPIKLPDGVTRTAVIGRLSEFASLVDEALAHRDDEDRVLQALAKVWPDQLRERAAASGKRKLDAAFRTAGAVSPVVTSHFGHRAEKKFRSYGDAA